MRKFLSVAVVVSAHSLWAALPNGAMLTSGGSGFDVRLQNGVGVHLGVRSSGKIYGDHFEMLGGAARLSHFSGYGVDARELRIEAETGAAEAVVRLGEKTVEVASLGGAVRVSEGGAMLTRVESGTKVAFQRSGASPGATGASKVKGTKSETKVFVWVIVAISAAALAIGLTAAAEGKSPF